MIACFIDMCTRSKHNPLKCEEIYKQPWNGFINNSKTCSFSYHHLLIKNRLCIYLYKNECLPHINIIINDAITHL